MDWKSQEQSIVAVSMVEAEYIALPRAGRQTQHLRHLLSTMGCEQEGPTTLYEDNIEAAMLAHSS